MTDVRNHTRINQTILGPLEKPALQWMAARLPVWVTPDTLTGIGIFASVLIFISFVLTNIHPGFLWLASFGVVLNWFGDSLDGTLARYRKIERPQYGFFVDHAVDAVSEVLVFLGVGLSPYVNFEVACLALIGYLLLSIYVYLYTYVKGVFQISFARLGPTEIRCIVIIANAIVFFVGNPLIRTNFGVTSLYNIIAATLAAVLMIAFLVISTFTALDLSKIDRLQAREKRRARKQQRRKRAKERPVPVNSTAED